MVAAPTGLEDGRSSAVRSSPRGPLPLLLYQAGMILLAILLLGLAGGAAGALGEISLPFLFTVIALWCLFDLGGFILHARARRLRRITQLRITVDLTFSLVMVWWSGGVESFFLPILFANVLIASTFFGRNRALLIASTATLGLGAMTVARILGWSPAEWMGAPARGVEGRISFLVSSLVTQGIAIHAIAFLGARLMGGLRRVERINDLIVENIGEGIVVLDEEGRMILLNDEALRILSHPRETSWQGCFPREVFRRRTDSMILGVLRFPEEGETHIDYEGQGRDVLPLSVKAKRIVGNRRGRSLWLFLLRDLTLERRAVQAEARIQHLEELEDLALGLAHEIRNPLASMRGCVQELAVGSVSREQAKRLERIVVRESDRLDGIVNEFLEYSRTSAGEVREVNLDTCIREVVEVLAQRPDAAGVSLEVRGPQSEECFVRGRREQLHRLFLNLGINAIEASDGAGSVAYRIHRGRADGWMVDVADEGTGMDRRTRARAFNPYFTTKAREGGLGLALVQKIVKGHGGTIEVESKEEEGACFRVWLPVEARRGKRHSEETSLAGVEV